VAGRDKTMSQKTRVELLRRPRDPSEAVTHRKSFDPFPGGLATFARRGYLLQCVYAH
jgi:hypothetical protein